MSLVNTSFQNELNRKLFIKKDILEVRQWIQSLEDNNLLLSHFLNLEKQLIQQPTIAAGIITFRSKNTLTIGQMCKYELELKQEFDNGSATYDQQRALLHEKKRSLFKDLNKEQSQLSNKVFEKLLLLKRF